MSDFLLKCESLEKSYLNKIIFKDISLEFTIKSSIAITGKNGSGKSTLLKVIANLIKPNKGKVKFINNSKEIKEEEKHFYLGMLAPYINLYEELTAFENLEFFYDLKNPEKDKSYRKEFIKTLLEKVNLYNRRNDEIKNYSSGMKQRIKLAFALINNPKILILDEPRTNLDVEGIDIVYKTADEQKQNGILIIATNEPEDTKLCEKSISIENYK